MFTLAFVAGVLAAAFSGWLVWIGVAAMAGMSGMLLLTRRAIWLPYALYTAVGLVGSLDYSLHIRTAASDVSLSAPCLIKLTGVVDSDPEILQHDPDSRPSTAHLILQATQAELSPSLANPQGGTSAVSGNVEIRLRLSTNLQDTDVSRSVPRYGDTIQVVGKLELPSGPRNPGGFDYRTYLTHQGIHATLFAIRAADWHIITESGQDSNPFLTLAYRLRQSVLRHARTGFTPERAAVLSGILLGDRANLPADLREDFERTGTTHILATAGLHVGLVMALLLGLFRGLRLSRRPALIATLLCLTLYIPMTGERVAMTRATIMALVYLGGVLFERDPYLPNTLSLAALILLVGNPQSLFDAGFQLSFGIVITVALLMPLLQRLHKNISEEAAPPGKVRSIKRFILDLFLIALAAQIGALPLVAYYFHSIPVVGVVANLLIVPIVLPILAFGFVATALATVAPILSVPLDKALDYLLAYIVTMTHALSAPNWASIPVGEFSPLLVVIAYALLWGGAWYFARPKEREPGETL